MKIIGRKKECEEFNELLQINRIQFVAVKRIPAIKKTPESSVIGGNLLGRPFSRLSELRGPVYLNREFMTSQSAGHHSCCTHSSNEKKRSSRWIPE